MRKNFKLLGAVAVAGVVAASGSAFTATSTIAANSTVGAATQSISGVTVTGAEYTWDAATDATTGVVLTVGAALGTNDTLVVKITGTADDAPATVTANCGVYTGVTTITCTSASLTNATSLSVVVS